MSRTRRDFARLCAIAGITPLVAPHAAPLLAQVPPPPEPTPAPPAAETAPLAAALTGAIVARYGDHLSSSERETIEHDLDRMTGLWERLRAVDLENGDEPAFIFRVMPGERR